MAKKEEKKETKEEAKEEVKEEVKEEIESDDSEEVSIEVEKDVMKEVPTEETVELPKSTFDVAAWDPKTDVGRKVKSGELSNIDEILDKGIKIFETPVVDVLIPDIESDLLLIGQAKGKFGGGQRRVFRQTQKKTREGNKPKFGTAAVVGNHNGYVGVGFGKSKETVPAREKAIRNAKLNVFKIKRGCGSWQCGCGEPHSIPFTVAGKCGSVEIKLIPAPKGKGLCVESECGKMLKFAGVNDVWARTKGQTGSKVNLIKACEKALRNLTEIKIKQDQVEKLGIVEGRIKKNE